MITAREAHQISEPIHRAIIERGITDRDRAAEEKASRDEYRVHKVLEDLHIVEKAHQGLFYSDSPCAGAGYAQGIQDLNKAGSILEGLGYRISYAEHYDDSDPFHGRRTTISMRVWWN